MNTAQAWTPASTAVSETNKLGDGIEFTEFAQAMHAPSLTVDAMATPCLADAWAKAIVEVWQLEYEASSLDPEQPLYVLDLSPGSGHFARLILQALREHMSRSDAHTHNLRYLACFDQESIEVDWIVDAGFAGDEGIDTLTWDPSCESMNPVPPSTQYNYRWNAAGNPVAVLALGYLQRQSAQLRAVHYGQWLEGRVCITASDALHYDVNYQWEDISGSNDMALPESLRQRYLRTLQSVCVLIPDAGLRALHCITKISAGRCFWLAADRGVMNETQLRWGASSPPAQWQRSGVALPVNFHALAYDQIREGAWSKHWQLEDVGIVVQVLWRHDGIDVPPVCYQTLARLLGAYHPDEALCCHEMASALPMEASPALRLTLMRAAGYDPRVLRSTWSVWAETPPEFSDAERQSWRDALPYAWKYCPRSGDESMLRHQLAVVATHLGLFQLARDIFAFDANANCVAWCDAMCGDLERALERLSGQADADDFAMLLHEEFAARAAHWRTLDWYHAACARDGDLALEPLGAEHVDAFFDQYRDPQIGILTGLPDFESPDAVRAWIISRGNDAGRASYAVMHADAGFVGVVSLHASEGSGYFYFWIGCDYQGREYGRRAGRLLQLQAAAWGVPYLFTSVYTDNQRSLDALESLGFRRMNTRAKPPDDELIFMLCELSDGIENRVSQSTVNRLANLLIATESHLVVDSATSDVGTLTMTI